MGVMQLFGQFYVDSPAKGSPEIGEFYWVPTPQTGFKVIENVRSSPEATKTLEVRLTDFAAGRHFQTKEHLPTLLVKEANAEALCYQAKMRPCLVLGSGVVENLNSIPDASQQRQAKTLAQRLYLVAPLYSCSCAAKPTQFTPIITARVRALHYPHLAYMPDFDGKEPGSILRLDNIFPTILGVGVTRVGKRLHEDVRPLIQAQLCEVLQLEMSDALRDYLKATKELVQGCLPEGLA